MDVDGCLACDLAEGRRPLPGGRIHETGHWLVEHCICPLGVGTLILKPKRHVVHLWELTEAEAEEFGPLLREASSVVAELTSPDQVYVGMWSHSGGVPVHIHFVVQPVSRALMEELDTFGPPLQFAMFDANELPSADEVEVFAGHARAAFA